MKPAILKPSPLLKPTAIRVYVDEAQTLILKRLSESTGMKQTDLMGTILSAGLKTLQDRDRLTLPLRFKIEE